MDYSLLALGKESEHPYMQPVLLRRTPTKRHLEFTCFQKSCLASFISRLFIVLPKRMTLSTCKIKRGGVKTREQRERRDAKELRTSREKISEGWGIRTILSEMETASPERT